MRIIAILCYYAILCIKGGANRLLSEIYKNWMISCGLHVRFSAITSDFTYRNISIGNDVYISILVLYLWRLKAAYI